MKKTVSIAMLIVAVAAPAFACEKPTTIPEIPDGKTAAMEEMMAAKKAVDAYKKGIEESQEHLPKSAFEAGNIGGNFLVQTGAAVGTWAIGRMADSPRTAAIGSDLIRAQFVSQVVVQGVDHRPQGLLPGRRITRASAQRLQAVVEAGQERFGREEAGAGSGELDCQRQAIEPHADFGHGAGVALVQNEVAPNRPDPLHKQGHRQQRKNLTQFLARQSR